MFILETSDADNEPLDTSYWENEETAWKEAAHCVQRKIYYGFNMSDVNQANIAKDINELVKNSNFKGAVKRWNRVGTTYDETYFNITSVDPLKDYDASDPMIFDDSHFIALLPDKDEEDDIDDAPVTAIVSGATCRGPCKQHNSYANADRKDNTYVCRSCQMMSQVFGGSIS